MNDVYWHAASKSAIIDPVMHMEQIKEICKEEDSPDHHKSMIIAQLKIALEHGRKEIAARLTTNKATGYETAVAYAYLYDQIIRIAYDYITNALYPLASTTESQRLAIMAVGGYGRCEMALYSDIDILFVTPYKQTAWHEQVIESLLNILWDLKLKLGHATRSIADTINYAKRDLTICTAMLDGRYLLGDLDLYHETVRAYRTQVVEGTAAQFVQQKLEERNNRHARMGDSRSVVEPNVKEGIGGLRDLQTLSWIARYVYNAQSNRELAGIGLFTDAELTQFRKAETFLWTIRCHMHLIADRAEERLTFNLQRELSQILGYKDRKGLSRIERFMKHYFLITKQVGDLVQLFLAHLEDLHTHKPLLRRLPSLRRKPRKLNQFVLHRNKICIPKADFFNRNPRKLLELFVLADRYDLPIHPMTLRIVGQNLTLIDDKMRNDPEANALFMELLCSLNTKRMILTEFNDSGLFGRFVPEFGRIIAQMQYDMYHHYTVDAHSIRAVQLLARIEKGDNKDYPALAKILKTMSSRRRLLYTAVLLHDIAKGQKGDHSIIGAEIAIKLCPRFGFDTAETETISWLVRNHLLMSMIAFKRDLSDPKTILDFAKIVQSPERLRLLFTLTCVDISAVGPGVWNGWKNQLLHELFEGCEELLIPGHLAHGRKERIAMKQELLFQEVSMGEKERTQYCERFADSYWIAEPKDVLVLNANLIMKADRKKMEIATDFSIDSTMNAMRLSVYVANHPGLFYMLAGAIALTGANIAGARIHTTKDGMAIDNFMIHHNLIGQYQKDEQRLYKRLHKSIKDVLTGQIKLSELLKHRQSSENKAVNFTLEPNVLINNQDSRRFTIIEVDAIDRPGLLYDLTYTLFQLKTLVHSSHVATWGEHIVDVFYVTDLTGAKIQAPHRLRALQKSLLSVAKMELHGPADTNSL